MLLTIIYSSSRRVLSSLVLLSICSWFRWSDLPFLSSSCSRGVTTSNGDLKGELLLCEVITDMYYTYSESRSLPLSSLYTCGSILMSTGLGVFTIASETGFKLDFTYFPSLLLAGVVVGSVAWVLSLNLKLSADSTFNRILWVPKSILISPFGWGFGEATFKFATVFSVTSSISVY